MVLQGDVTNWEQVRSAANAVMQRIVHLSQESGYRLRAFQVPSARPLDTGSVAVTAGLVD